MLVMLVDAVDCKHGILPNERVSVLQALSDGGDQGFQEF